jgi:hypothetical protein
MGSLPTVSLIGHHAFFIFHAHSCVLLKHAELFGSYTAGFHIRVTSTFTQLNSCKKTDSGSVSDKLDGLRGCGSVVEYLPSMHDSQHQEIEKGGERRNAWQN